MRGRRTCSGVSTVASATSSTSGTRVSAARISVACVVTTLARRRHGGSRWPRRASWTARTTSRRCGPWRGPSSAPACSRSTRSTCCSGRTSCRCTPGWGPTTSTCSPGASARKPRRLVEYWAHVQALMPVELWPVMRHRMESYRTQKHKWWGTEVSDELVTNLMAEIADRGACTARDLDDGLPRDKKHWGWNWSATKRALDYMYMTGEVAIAGRNSQFEVRYDLPERVLPADVLAAPHAHARGGQPRARPTRRAVARRRDGALPGRLLPHPPGTGEAGRGPARRGGRARAGADPGLEPAGLPPPRRPATRAASTHGRC